MTSVHRLAGRIALTLFAVQSIGSAGFIVAATVGSLVGAALGGHPAYAGVPTAVFLVGSSAAAYVWGALMDRAGRRASLAFGLATGVAGALVAGSAVVRGDFTLLLAGLLFMGSAQAALQLSRFVAAEVHPRASRGRAVANVVLGGAIGAVVGPLLVGPVGAFADARALPALAGPYFASAVLFAAACTVVALRLVPDPARLARLVEAREPRSGGPQQAARSLRALLRDGGVLTAMSAMVFGQMVMVMLMVITALHMEVHAHGLGAISIVISAHTLGMYAPSLFTGRLADRWGRLPVLLAGATLLIASCAVAPLSPDLAPLSAALFGLGLGWNLLFVGGSALLSDRLTPSERARTQGLNDLLVGAASALGSLGSGVVFATLGYAATGALGVTLAFVPLAFALWWSRSTGPRATPAEPS